MGHELELELGLGRVWLRGQGRDWGVIIVMI